MDHHEKRVVWPEGKSWIPLVYAPPIKWTDRTLPVCLFFCIRHCEDDPAAQPCWSQDETVTIYFLPQFVHDPYGEREENGKRKKRSAFFIFHAYYICFSVCLYLIVKLERLE